MAGHYCTEHKTVFFKKGKMRGYAHPIGDTGEWCNEPEEGGDPIPKEHQEETQYKADPDKTKSIERQSCLKAAVEIAVARIMMGSTTVTPAQVLSNATIFEAYLSSGATVESKEAKDG